MIRYPTDLIWKHCSGCCVFKPNYMFLHNKVCKNNRAGRCTACFTTYNNKHYQDNITHKRSLATKKNRERKDRAIEYLGGRCQDCSGIYHRCAYDFHHIGDKDMNPSAALAGSWEKALKELDKCVLLCASCHRVRHFGEDEDDC